MDKMAEEDTRLSKISHILDSIDDCEYKSVTDRYYSKRYYLNAKDIPNNDYLLLFHSNKICVLTLAPSHFLFRGNVDFTINFAVGKVDRSKNEVRGKGKRGAQVLEPTSSICTVECEDGTSFVVPSCMKGKLVEVNDALIERPHLLKEKADAEGYVAVILANLEISQATKDELITHEDYLLHVKKGAQTEVTDL